MATTTTSSNINNPKPKGKLEDQAAIAALYVTKGPAGPNNEYLDNNNRLSSAGAAASLKYANPQDLPSFPSYGLRRDDSAAGAAASLGWANQKPFEHWKPDPSASASAAAAIAKDYKMKPLWQPEQSQSGAKAAVLAHKENGKVEIWKPEASDWGNSAANQAFKKAGVASPPPPQANVYVNRQGSLMAATGAMSTNRRRAESTPIPPVESYPDARNATGNALKAAVSVHKRKPSDSANIGGSTPYTNMPKEMFTSHPPVAPEVDELNRQNTLRASAVAMAKGMYAQQQKSIEAAKNMQSGAGAKAAHKRSSSVSSDDVQPMYLGNVEEAARKLAQERLAKLHNEHTKFHENADYREYYGSKQPQSRLSIRGRTRRRASSDGTYDEDREQSNKIRTQMSMFSTNLSQVDEQKRAKDRESLIAIAQKNVTNKLHGMDEKVFADTGKVAPSLLSEWELKAHKAAQANSANRMENYGKVNIGGGKFINQSAVDLIATKNVQPVLDEINEKAQIERERQAAIKAEQLEQQRKAEALKQRERENKEIHKKLKQQDKDEERARKAEEKATKEEVKRAEKEKRRSLKVAALTPTVKDTSTAPKSTLETPETNPDSGVVESEAKETNTAELVRGPSPTAIATSSEVPSTQHALTHNDQATQGEITPASPTKDGSNIKSWLKSKLSTRRQSKSAKSPTTDKPEKTAVVEDKTTSNNQSSLVGGTVLTEPASHNQSATSIKREGSSERDVALAGKSETQMNDNDSNISSETDSDSEEEVVVARSTTRDSKVSALSGKAKSDDDEFLEARDNFDEDLMATPTFPSDRMESPARDSKFKEII